MAGLRRMEAPMDNRMKYSHWFTVDGKRRQYIPWSEQIYEAVNSMQASGMPCPSCFSMSDHLASCQIWLPVEDAGLYTTSPKLGTSVEEILGPDGPTQPTEENLNKWAEGRISDGDRSELSKDSDIMDVLARTTVPEEVARACQAELAAAKQRGWKSIRD